MHERRLLIEALRLLEEAPVADPTIKIASCRSDKRCPECCLSLQERGGRLSLLPLPSCGCHCCPEHERGHLKGLLAEALSRLEGDRGGGR